MQNLAQLLQKKYRVELRYFQAVEVIETHWDQLFKNLAQFIRPRNIYHNKLVIECNNSAWLSEIDFFNDQIIQKVNDLLSSKKIKVKIIGIKPLLNSNMIISESKKPLLNLPKSFEDRIDYLLNEKKKNGATLCKSCGKVWDHFEICGLCRLTSA